MPFETWEWWMTVGLVIYTIVLGLIFQDNEDWGYE